MSTSKLCGFLLAFVSMVSMTANAHDDKRYNIDNIFKNDLKTRMESSMSKFLCDYTSTSASCTWTSIRSDQVCDGRDHCTDGTDEMGCRSTPAPTTCPTCDIIQKCSDTEFTCNNKTCIPIENICDGNNDCGDMSDETGSICDKCTCDDDEFQCTYSKECIPRTMLCDGIGHCKDKTDEPDNCLCTINATAPTFCATEDPGNDSATIAMFKGDIPNVCVKSCRINKNCKAIIHLLDDACYLRSSIEA